MNEFLVELRELLERTMRANDPESFTYAMAAYVDASMGAFAAAMERIKNLKEEEPNDERRDNDKETAAE